MMNKINEIYRNMMQETEEMMVQRATTEKCIEAILEEHRKEMRETEYEIYRDMFYQVAMVAEEGGFVLGFQYAMQLAAECYTKRAIAKLE